MGSPMQDGFTNCHLSSSGYQVEDTCHGHGNL